MTYQFPVTAWRPRKVTPGSAASASAINQAEFVASLAEALAPRRRRRPTTGTTLEMLAQLEFQARELLEMAGESDTVAPFRTFTAYRMFRARLSDFQAFCGVIETQLAGLASKRRRELQERFYALWGAVLKPSVRGLGVFFSVIARDGVMPLGAREMLEEEMLALEVLANTVSDPRFENVQHDELVAEIQTLIKAVGRLAERASSLPELVDRRVRAA
jgi:hypothetical protein